jgi:hypothetical protein
MIISWELLQARKYSGWQVMTQQWAFKEMIGCSVVMATTACLIELDRYEASGVLSQSDFVA